MSTSNSIFSSALRPDSENNDNVVFSIPKAILSAQEMKSQIFCIRTGDVLQVSFCVPQLTIPALVSTNSFLKASPAKKRTARSN